jgi:hypothetical protein
MDLKKMLRARVLVALMAGSSVIGTLTAPSLWLDNLKPNRWLQVQNVWATQADAQSLLAFEGNIRSLETKVSNEESLEQQRRAERERQAQRVAFIRTQLRENRSEKLELAGQFVERGVVLGDLENATARVQELDRLLAAHRERVAAWRRQIDAARTQLNAGRMAVMEHHCQDEVHQLKLACADVEEAFPIASDDPLRMIAKGTTPDEHRRQLLAQRLGELPGGSSANSPQIPWDRLIGGHSSREEELLATADKIVGDRDRLACQ